MRKPNASTSGAGSPASATTVTKKTIDRKTVEKNRRIQMKRLCNDLASTILSKKKVTSQLDQLEQATNYIAQLRERVQQLKERKTKLAMLDANEATSTDSRYPIMELRDLGCCLEVILVSRLQKNFTLFEVIRVIEDEGAEVVGVNVVTLGNKVYHTLHAQVKSPRVGVDTSMIGGRLQELISNGLRV